MADPREKVLQPGARDLDLGAGSLDLFDRLLQYQQVETIQRALALQQGIGLFDPFADYARLNELGRRMNDIATEMQAITARFDVLSAHADDIRRECAAIKLRTLGHE